MPEVNIDELKQIASQKNRYENQINRLKAARKQTSCIEEAVTRATDNIRSGKRSFVIYGEPQSGKTEMMICLTGKLADDGHRVIVHLLNDSVQLLQQNLDRFQRSKLSPSAKNFADVLDPDYSLKSGHWPAPGSEDTELGVFMGPEVRHGEAEVYARVQA